MKQLKTNIAASIRDIASIWKGFSLPKTPPTEIITAAAANPPLSILKHFCNSKERALESSLANSSVIGYHMIPITCEKLRGTCKERLLHHRCELYPHDRLVRSQVS